MTPYSEFAHTGTIHGRDELPRINKYRVQQASMVSITRTHKRRSLKQRISLGVFTNKHDEETWNQPDDPPVGPGNPGKHRPDLVLRGRRVGVISYEITPTCQG